METARNFGWQREVIGSDGGGKEGHEKGGGDNAGDASDGRVPLFIIKVFKQISDVVEGKK